jgi:hypothetical protein
MPTSVASESAPTTSASRTCGAWAATAPTVAARGAGAHADVEWVDLDDLVRLAQILLATATSFCS